MPSMLMKHDTDPAQLIWKRIGNLETFKPTHNHVVLAIYERPKETKSGIHIPDQYRAEEIYQGKAALIVAKGPTAFIDTAQWNFSAVPMDIGDWVAIRASDGWDCVVNSVHCRMVPDTAIRAKISAPDVVW